MDPTGEDDDTDGGPTDPAALARAYYRALDAGDYDLLASVLAADFVHERPDLTLEGREPFVRFMREERPQTDTTHPIEGIYVPVAAAGDSPEPGDETARGDEGTATEVVARGRLLAADGSRIATFVDVFGVADGALQRLRTFTH